MACEDPALGAVRKMDEHVTKLNFYGHSSLTHALSSPFLEDGARSTLSKQHMNRNKTTNLRVTSYVATRYMIIFGLAFPLAAFIIMVQTGKRNQIPGTQYSVSSWEQTSVTYANYIGDASFAISGSVTAGKKGMDCVGCVLIGFITALGGGSIRDLCLGCLPLGWLKTYDETLLVLGFSASTFFLWSPLSHLFKLTESDEWLFWTDTVGLGVFTASGAHVGNTSGATFVGSIICGLMTATFGGIMRDTLCQQPARILFAHKEVYALPALAGATGYMVVISIAESLLVEAILIGTWIGMFARVMAINHFVVMPTFSTDWWASLLSVFNFNVCDHPSGVQNPRLSPRIPGCEVSMQLDSDSTHGLLHSHSAPSIPVLDNCCESARRDNRDLSSFNEHSK